VPPMQPAWENSPREDRWVRPFDLDHSMTEIPAERLCINKEDGVRRRETICGTFRNAEGNTMMGVEARGSRDSCVSLILSRGGAAIPSTDGRLRYRREAGVTAQIRTVLWERYGIR
jgi:hypothetical protein